ncbi:16S rRNA (guanine(1207)-N(2))-methyltransferase RsmC [Vibrio penaeicida]|uniref:Ribosomal RNA small subunit methyltransferase C n=1 Tax=Vibrio penaeicida TaxID=104609 RepID=A0AAV5NLS7_9VIBR|nr:16S rRNA (guanine(1207)-N(2))-methyltransferase RsmC [Vibrio penaeicida]RTZ21107.1 16S rRNA (guanine(1207)-N(2))-methyltransferase RsmC [Vibrio penaeicida]GLQ71590.1 ribosomal RNA small subunit methyltransferase C [Vibrio penaeicida]
MSAFTAPSQIAERNLEYFNGKHVLVAGEAEDLFPIELAKNCESVSVFTTHYGYYRQLENHASIQRFFGEEFTAPSQADLILLYWPKAKAEAEYLLAMLMSKLGADTEVVVIGENRSGIKSIEKFFKPYGVIKKYDSARRCSFYWGQCTSEPAEFDIQQWYKSYSLNIGGADLTIKSLPGVFSHGEFDLGTQLLLKTLPNLAGKVLDFGCGAGVIGAAMANQFPEINLSMCDVSALAVASSKATLTANNIEGHVFATDVYSDVNDSYDFLISNPPFHSGLDTSYSATETLLAQAPAYLNKKGTLHIVANSFLKYPPIIEKAFGHCELADKTTKFAIYQANKA